MAMIARDVEETSRIYQDFLGWPLVELMETATTRARPTSSSTSATGTCWRSSTSPAWTSTRHRESIGACQHIAISVTRESFDALVAKLDEAGIDYLGADRGPTNSVYFTDPNGIQLELLAEPLLEMDGRAIGAPG